MSLAEEIYKKTQQPTSAGKDITEEAKDTSSNRGLMSPDYDSTETGSVAPEPSDDSDTDTIDFKDVGDTVVNFFTGLTDNWDKNNVKTVDPVKSDIEDANTITEDTTDSSESLVSRPSNKIISLKEVKQEIFRTEGTEGPEGLNMLLGNQQDNFNVTLVDMTVQEVLDFQEDRGPDSYAEYSKTVNKKRGFLREDGTPQISTPAGLYQATGQTVSEMIAKGIIKPDDKFNEATQEKIGNFLITKKRGYDEYKKGEITFAEFKERLGKEFEGIAIRGFKSKKV